jgi:hypothetical protein
MKRNESSNSGVIARLKLPILSKTLKEQYKTQIESSEDLEELSEKEFSRVLKSAIEAQELNAIGAGLKTRLESRKLQLLDLCNLQSLVINQSVVLHS